MNNIHLDKFNPKYNGFHDIKWMNVNYREIRRLRLSRLLIDIVAVAVETAFCLRYWPFVCSVAKLVFGGLFVVSRLSKHFSAVHSVVIVCAGDIRLLFQLLLEFRNVLWKYPRRHRNSVGGFPLLWHETKRTCKQIPHENIHAVRDYFARKNWLQCIKIA